MASKPERKMASKQCANCVKCTYRCGIEARQKYSEITCAAAHCLTLCQTKDGKQDVGTVEEKDRLQNSDSPVNDPPADKDMIKRIEKKLTDKDPTNPLRGKIVEIGTYEDGDLEPKRKSKRIRWGAILYIEEEFVKKWSEKIVNEKKSAYGEKEYKLGVTRASQIEHLVECYEAEKGDGDETNKNGRFIHLNTGSHGDSKGKTIENTRKLLKIKGSQAEVNEYLNTSVRFAKKDLENLKTKKRTSVFLINSISVPIYPENKDVVDGWCMSQQMQDERYKLYLDQKDIAKELRTTENNEEKREIANEGNKSATNAFARFVAYLWSYLQ